MEWVERARGRLYDFHQMMGRADLLAGRLVALLPGYQSPSRSMHLLYAQDRYRLPKLRAFVDFALEQWAR